MVCVVVCVGVGWCVGGYVALCVSVGPDVSMFVPVSVQG